MNLGNALSSTLTPALDRGCGACGRCVVECDGLADAGASVSEILRTLADATSGCADGEGLRSAVLEWREGNDQHYRALRRCFLCGRCAAGCPSGSASVEGVLAARALLNEAGLIERGAYQSVQVDRDWHIFTAYRAVHGIWYEDLVRHVDCEGEPVLSDFDAAFFPGCSLMAYAPDLVRLAFGEIEACGFETTLIDSCCGSPLKSAGFPERVEGLLDDVLLDIGRTGARLVVCACPGCERSLQEAIGRNRLDMDTVSLPELLLTRSARFEEGAFSLDDKWLSNGYAVLKPCQDVGPHSRAVSSLLARGGARVLEVGGELGCCGAGGGVSSFDPEFAARRSLGYFRSVGPADAVRVTVCPTCSYTLASHLLEGTLPPGAGVLNYLEILFDSPIDWNSVFDQLGGMWTGEYAGWLIETLC